MMKNIECHLNGQYSLSFNYKVPLVLARIYQAAQNVLSYKGLRVTQK